MYSDNYIFFNDIDLKIKNNFECATNDYTMWMRHLPGSDMNSSQQNDPQLFPVQGPIRKYFECDYKMYQDFGSNTTNVNNFVTSIYNANIAFYQNDQITTLLQSVYIWTDCRSIHTL